MLRNPKKRSYDTALILMEIIHGGFGSPRGARALDVLIHAHDRVTAAADEYRYVLLSLSDHPAPAGSPPTAHVTSPRPRTPPPSGSTRSSAGVCD